MEEEEVEQRDPIADARATRKEKQNAAADRTTQALDNAANIAQFTPIGGYAKTYKVARSIDDKLTGGKLSRGLSKVANKTAPGTKALGQIGSSGLANIANRALAAKEKLSGKGGSSGSSTSTAPKTASSAPKSQSTFTIGGSNAKSNTNESGKKSLDKKKKNQNSQSSPSNTTSEKRDESSSESDSMTTLIGELTPMKIVIIAVVLFIFMVIYMFVVLFSSIANQHEIHLLQGFGDIASSSKTTAAPYEINNINSEDNDNSSTIDFSIYNREYQGSPDGTYSDERDNSKKSDLYSWVKRIFPAEIYMNFFNIGNVFNTGKKCYGDNCSSRAEVQFYQKVADISYRYKKLYNIELDWPLIMSTIFIRSYDKEETFAANLTSYRVGELKDLKKTMSLDWDYDYQNIPGYDYLSPNDGRYDLQILAKNMVKKKTVQSCVDAKGNVLEKLELEDIEDSVIEKAKEEAEDKKKTTTEDDDEEKYYLVCKKGKYNINSTYTLDKDKYKEFLDEYLEKRLLLPKSTTGNIYGGTDSEIGQAVINVALSQNGVSNRTPFTSYMGLSNNDSYCAAFVSWVFANTSYSGSSVYPSVVPFKTASARQFMLNFNSSSNPNIKFYYNDKCSKFSGRNGGSYTPKVGDLIFFNWNGDWDGDMNHMNTAGGGKGTIGHVGFVISYNGATITTIEGNTSGGKVAVRERNNNCTVVGYGSWY